MKIMAGKNNDDVKDYQAVPMPGMVGMPSDQYVDPETGTASTSTRGLMAKSGKSVASSFSMKQPQDIGQSHEKRSLIYHS
jgi:hypothetical protein